MIAQHQVAQRSQPLIALSSRLLQRACACGKHTADGEGECAECKHKRGQGVLQRAAIAPAPDVAPPIVHDVLRSPGQPLDPATRAFMEPRYGHDFGDVRVHTDARAADSASAVDALAYTVGNHVAFGAGQYQPNSSAGQKLLGHELAHVVQQKPFSASSGPALLPIGAEDDMFEREAAEAGMYSWEANALTAETNDTSSAAPILRRKPTGKKAQQPAEKHQMAVYPGEALRAWKSLKQIDRDAVLWEMISRYGPDFASDFMNYANGKKKPNYLITASNSPDLTSKNLKARGYALAGAIGSVSVWVHPSGHIFHVLSPSKSAQQPSQPAPAPNQSGTQQPSQPAPAPNQPDDRQQRCADPCMDQTDDEDECKQCCIDSIPENDQACRRTCNIACSTKL